MKVYKRTRPSRHGPGPGFILTGCVEEQRPKRPSLALVDPPKWALRQVCHNTGRRSPKWQRTEVKSWAHPGYLMGDSEYDFGSYEEQASPREKKKLRKEKRRSARDVIPRGNLKEEEYRFWKGAAQASDPSSICRWCFGTAYTAEQRRNHHALLHCNAKLMVVYKLGKSLEHPKCFVCGHVGHWNRWGVPLCNNPGCLSRWKFSPIHFLDTFVDMRKQATLSGYLDNFKETS